MLDKYNREIKYVRISVTDKCNLRCEYCMPGDIEHLPMSEILSFEEICESVRCMAELGISRVKLTGGEPLIRRDIEGLVRNIKSVPGIEQVTMTTNGVFLPEKLEALTRAGLDGINISIDTLDRERYKKLTGFDMLDKALKGLEMAVDSGIPVHVNAVSYDSSMIGGRNDTGVEGEVLFNGEPSGVMNERDNDSLADTWELIELARDKDIAVRFIELMPIGFAKGFPAVPHDILKKRVMEKYSGMKRLDDCKGNGPAVYYSIPGFKGRIGFISAMHEGYCADCNRIRLTTRGFIKSCLSYDTGVDIREVLRMDAPVAEKYKLLKERISEAILLKPKCHSFYDEKNMTETNAMSAIGG